MRRCTISRISTSLRTKVCLVQMGTTAKCGSCPNPPSRSTWRRSPVSPRGTKPDLSNQKHQILRLTGVAARYQKNLNFLFLANGRWRREFCGILSWFAITCLSSFKWEAVKAISSPLSRSRNTSGLLIGRSPSWLLPRTSRPSM